MNKKVLIGLLPFLLISGCAKLERDEDPTVPSEPSEKEALVSDLKEGEYNLFANNYIKKVNSFTSYKAVTKGQTETVVLFSTIIQTIDVTSIKSEYSYQLNASHSDMYNSEHEAFYHNDKAAYKNLNETEYTVSTMDEYLDKYGVYPFENRIEGYKVTDETLLSVTKLENDKDDNYRFKLDLDTEKATNNVKIQMKEFGSLDQYPSFSIVSLIVSVKNDYTPVKIELESRYTATKVIQTSCHQTYTVTFTNFNETLEIPNLNNVKGLI